MGRNPQISYGRGFFYAVANKKGTNLDEQGVACTVGNYMPAWVYADGVFKYRAQGRWAENFWKQYKLDDQVFEQYIYLTRGNVLARNTILTIARHGNKCSMMPSILKPSPNASRATLHCTSRSRRYQW